MTHPGVTLPPPAAGLQAHPMVLSFNWNCCSDETSNLKVLTKQADLSIFKHYIMPSVLLQAE
jgi:hypothetical protein